MRGPSRVPFHWHQPRAGGGREGVPARAVDAKPTADFNRSRYPSTSQTAASSCFSIVAPNRIGRSVREESEPVPEPLVCKLPLSDCILQFEHRYLHAAPRSGCLYEGEVPQLEHGPFPKDRGWGTVLVRAQTDISHRVKRELDRSFGKCRGRSADFAQAKCCGDATLAGIRCNLHRWREGWGRTRTQLTQPTGWDHRHLKTFDTPVEAGLQ
jgi:hypothetical protein